MGFNSGFKGLKQLVLTLLDRTLYIYRKKIYSFSWSGREMVVKPSCLCYTGWAQIVSLITNIYYKKTSWNKNLFFFQNITQEVFFLQHISTLQHVLIFIPRSFFVINVCNLDKILCSPCTFF